MTIIKKAWKLIRHDMTWVDRVYCGVLCTLVAVTIFYMVPENYCNFWIDDLGSAGYKTNSRSNGGCYQAGFKHEQKQNYAKAKYYFSEAKRKAQAVCDSGRNKDACTFAEDSEKQLKRIAESEESKK